MQTNSPQCKVQLNVLKAFFMKQIQQLKLGDNDFAKRLEQSEMLLSRANGALAQYYKSSRDKTIGHGLGASYRLVVCPTHRK